MHLCLDYGQHGFYSNTGGTIRVYAVNNVSNRSAVAEITVSKISTTTTVTYTQSTNTNVDLSG